MCRQIWGTSYTYQNKKTYLYRSLQVHIYVTTPTQVSEERAVTICRVENWKDVEEEMWV
jgi:hypothetical protein